MLRIKGIECDGELGQFRANVNMMGWKSDETGDAQIHESKTVKRAEYLEGKLRVACQEDGDEEETVLGLNGFSNSDFDSLAQYFQDYCGVTVKRHTPAETQPAEEEPAVESFRQLTNSFGLVNETNCGILDDDLVEQEDIPEPSAPPASSKEGDGGYTAPAAPTPFAQATSKTPTPQPEAQSRMQCKSCTFINTQYDAKCQMCEAPLEGSDTAAWNCHKCTLENPLTTFSCEACGTVRPKPRRERPNPNGNGQIALMNPRKWQGQSSSMAESDDSPGGAIDAASRSAAAARKAHEDERPDRGRSNYMREDSIMEGWVWKESRFMKRFRKRWMVLGNDSIEWIARAETNEGGAILNVRLVEKMKQKKEEPTETIKTRDVYKVYDQTSRPGGRCFSVDANGKTITMICDDAGDKEEWMSKLKAASGRASPGVSR